MNKFRELKVSNIFWCSEIDLSWKIVINFWKYSLYQKNKPLNSCIRCVLLSLWVQQDIEVSSKNILNDFIKNNHKRIILWDNNQDKEIDIKTLQHPMCSCLKYEVSNFNEIKNKVNWIVYLENNYFAWDKDIPLYVTETYYQSPIYKKVEIAFWVWETLEKSRVKSRGEFIERYTICIPYCHDIHQDKRLEEISIDHFYIPENFSIKQKTLAIVEDLYWNLKMVDAGLVYMNLNWKSSFISSCWSASHVIKKDAKKKAFLELIEKNDLMNSWRGDYTNSYIFDDLRESTFRRYKKIIEKKYGFQLHSFVHNSIKWVYTVECIAINKEHKVPYIFHSSSADIDILSAVFWALEELIGFIYIYHSRTFDSELYPNISNSNFKYLYPENRMSVLKRMENIKEKYILEEQKSMTMEEVYSSLPEQWIEIYFKDFGDSIITFKWYHIYRCISPQLTPITFGKDTIVINKSLNIKKTIKTHPYI